MATAFHKLTPLPRRGGGEQARERERGRKKRKERERERGWSLLRIHVENLALITANALPTVTTTKRAGSDKGSGKAQGPQMILRICLIGYLESCFELEILNLTYSILAELAASRKVQDVCRLCVPVPFPLPTLDPGRYHDPVFCHSEMGHDPFWFESLVTSGVYGSYPAACFRGT